MAPNKKTRKTKTETTPPTVRINTKHSKKKEAKDVEAKPAKPRFEPFGRPSKYKPEFCQQLIDFFDVEPWGIENGKRVYNRMPTLRRFAKSIGAGISTVYDWIDSKHDSYHPDFSGAFTQARGIRKDWLCDAGLSGLCPPNSFKFVAVNVTDMRDKTETELSGSVDLKPPEIT